MPETNNEDCAKTVESIVTSVGVKTNTLKAFCIQSKIENKSRNIIAEVQTNWSKRLIMENVKN